MKIYTRIVMDLTQDDLPVVEADGYEYDGPLALCWGSGDGGGRDGPEGGGGSAGASSAGGPGAGPGGASSGGGGDGGGRGGPEGGGGSMSGVGPSGFGGGGDVSGGGWGDSPHGNPGGTRGPSPDNYGGMSSGLSSPTASHSVGTDRGGIMSSPHENPHGIGLSHNQPAPAVGSISPRDVHFSQIDAREIYGPLPGWPGIKQDLGLAWDTMRHAGVHNTIGGVMSGNLALMGYGLSQNIGYSNERSDARAEAGLGPMSAPEGLSTGAVDGGGSQEELRRQEQNLSSGSPMKNALKLAFKRDMDAAKQNVISQALQRQRGAA